ncbi:RidA family protein [Pigmentiphaga soli]|uniref:RidA family protein n=1 Tax=Pigmentiphaga soli TaxID=1007095 RepID=A0ABP8GZE5_9BURK
MQDAIYHFFDDGPRAVAPYSHAVQAGDWLFVTGQMPFLDDGTVPEGIEAQTEACVRNLRTIMARSGFGEAAVMFSRVYLTRFETHYERMNAVYRTLFEPGRLPARTCIGVTGLARGCDIEIDFVAKRA